MGTKKEKGGGSPYEPYKPAPSGPYTPAPKRDSLKLATFSGSSSDMGRVTEKGFFIDDKGDAYINTPDGLLLEGEYNPDVHGLYVPLANRKTLNIKKA